MWVARRLRIDVDLSDFTSVPAIPATNLASTGQKRGVLDGWGSLGVCGGGNDGGGKPSGGAQSDRTRTRTVRTDGLVASSWAAGLGRPVNCAPAEVFLLGPMLFGGRD